MITKILIQDLKKISNRYNILLKEIEANNCAGYFNSESAYRRNTIERTLYLLDILKPFEKLFELGKEITELEIKNEDIRIIFKEIEDLNERTYSLTKYETAERSRNKMDIKDMLFVLKTLKLDKVGI